jgi:hypothetical protein
LNIKLLRQWREAHPGLEISDDALSPIEDFPSLRVNDVAPAFPDAGPYIKELGRECAWAYGLAEKAQSQSKAEDLMESLINEALTDPVIRKFLVDYAKANNIRVVG